jgi:hypothetical protein
LKPRKPRKPKTFQGSPKAGACGAVNALEVWILGSEHRLQQEVLNKK